MRTLFNGLFLNIGSDPAITEIAKESAAELAVYLRILIAERIEQNSKNPTPPVDVLGRLLAACPTGDLLPGDEAVRRSISGLIIGAVDTTSAASIRVVDELLRRPNWLKKASDVARQNDLKALDGYVLEALRFNPHNPLQLRFCANDYTLGSGKLVSAGSTMVAATLGGMFDKNAFPDPRTFNPNRDRDNYLHYGYGMHACQGRYINGLQITTLVGELLKLKNLRRVSGSSGHLLFDGPFPDRLILAFESGPRS
jgi:cytochrome P450